MNRKCTLLITYSCNLNCIYCYEKHKSSVSMNVQTAKNIITKEIQFIANSDKYDSIDFHFMGGEPLLNFDLIKKVCEWAWNQNFNIPFHFYVITNGTLFTDDIKRWFEYNRHLITVDMSVDGIDIVHKTNRGCSPRQLPLEWVLKNWPMSRFKMTISSQSISHLAESIITLTNQGYNILATLALGEEWNEEEFAMYAKEWNKIVNYYLHNENLNIWKQLLQPLDSLFNLKQDKCCGSGDTFITYNYNGDAYPCVIFSPIVWGKDIRNSIASIDFSDIESFSDKDCRDCFIRNACKTCYGFNLLERGNLACRDKHSCNAKKIELLFVSKFQIELLKKVTQRALSAKELVRLQQAKKAFEVLSNELSVYLS